MFTAVGAKTVQSLAACGQFSLFVWHMVLWLVAGLPRWRTWRLVMPQFYEVGNRTLPVIMVTGTFVGLVLAVQSFDTLKANGIGEYTGALLTITLVRELGPVLAGLMLAGRVGGAFTAELGTMRVTEQLDAMRAMGVDPIAHLVVPRVFACVIMIPLLTVFSDLLGVLGGYIVTVRGFGVSADDYWAYSASIIIPFDVFTGLIKSVFFGLAIGLISCYKGFYCASGAAGVGRATTDAFVTSFIAIIVANFFLAKLLNDLVPWFLGPAGGVSFV